MRPWEWIRRRSESDEVVANVQQLAQLPGEWWLRMGPGESNGGWGRMVMRRERERERGGEVSTANRNAGWGRGIARKATPDRNKSAGGRGTWSVVCPVLRVAKGKRGRVAIGTPPDPSTH